MIKADNIDIAAFIGRDAQAPQRRDIPGLQISSVTE
jgi:hypothetical protein